MASPPAWPSPLGGEALRARWMQAVVAAGAPQDAAMSAWAALEEAHGHPVRRYHTLEHLGELFALLDVITEDHAPLAVELAAWTHDVVYDPTRTDNEAQSAAWARSVLDGLGVDEELVGEVVRLVRATADHDPSPSDAAGQLLTDADLGILAAPPERYSRYRASVRAEYGHLDAHDWSKGRAVVLDGLLARQRLYHHDALRTWDDRARANMRTERAALRG